MAVDAWARSAIKKGDLVPHPGVSVIIVNWNTRDMVLRLLASLSTRAEESVQELELIVVDNDSSDGSVDAIRREFPSVKLVAQTENRGFAGGVNPGIQAATQPLVLLLNSDTQTTRASIEEAAQYIAEHPEAGILGPRVLNPDGSHQPSCWREPSLIWLVFGVLGLDYLKPFQFAEYGEREFTEATEVDCVCGSTMMIRRDLLKVLGGLDEDYFMYFEETDLCVRARRHGMKVHHAPVGDFRHESGGSSKSAKLRTFLDFRRSQILFYRKHHGVAVALAARGLLVMGSALRVPPLAALALVGRPEQARAQLKLRWNGLKWLLNPFSGLVPDVDRAS